MLSRNLAEHVNTTTIDNASIKLGLIFKQARRKRSLSQNSLSEAANINNSYYCSVERGTVNVTIKKFLCICCGLEIPPDEVMRKLQYFQEGTEDYGEI